MIDGITLIKGLFYFMLKGKEGGKYLSRKRVTGKNGKAKWVYDYGKKKGKIVRIKDEIKLDDNNKVNYPKDYETLHEVSDWGYAKKIAQSAVNGAKIPPIIINGVQNNGMAINGTHRMAARYLLDKNGYDKNLIPIEVYSNEELEEKFGSDLIEALQENDYDKIQNILDGNSK